MGLGGAFTILGLFFLGNAFAETGAGSAALTASREAKITAQSTASEKIARALALINVQNYLHRNEKEGSENQPPPGGTHPYEWDSLRSSEEMLKNGDGGSCGTHGLSVAGILRASGIPSADIQLVGAVLPQDYAEICPGKAGERRAQSWTLETEGGKKEKSDVHPANGHVFLGIRIGGQIPYGDIGKMDLTGNRPPTFLPAVRFPSLAAHMGQEGGPPPPLLAFSRWSYESHPRHTIADRNNMVASGHADRSTCRWSGAEVLAGAGASGPPGKADH